MLVLNRRKGEEIVIQFPGSRELVIIKLVEIDHARKQVKLGFTAGKKIKIVRTELLPG